VRYSCFCLTDKRHVEPSVFLFDPKDLSSASKFGFGEEVYSGVYRNLASGNQHTYMLKGNTFNMDTVDLLASFVIGLVSSAAILFLSDLGMQGFEVLPSRIFTKRAVSLYMFFGGFFAVVFQLPQSSFTPIQALAIGAAWPAILVGYTVPQRAKEIATEEIEKYKKLLEELDG